MLGDQVGVLAQAVAGALDADDGGVVQEPVEQRGGHDRVAEHVPPLGESLVRGEDHGALLVAGVDELEEEVGGLGVDGDVADLVDDEQGGASVVSELVVEAVGAARRGEGVDELGEGGSVDAAAGLDGGDAERAGEVALAGAGGPEEVDRLGPVDEVELGEGHDAVPVERRLEGEVEALEGLRRVEPGDAQRDADAAGLAEGELAGEEFVDGAEGVGLPALDAPDDRRERFEGVWHAQADEAGLDLFENSAHGVARPAPASLRPTAS